jgi:hypothetical protein
VSGSHRVPTPATPDMRTAAGNVLGREAQ